MVHFRQYFCCAFLAIFSLILIASPAQAQQRFGATVLVTDGEIMIAEPENIYRPGTVYVFGKDNGSWVQRAEITAPDARMGDHFGRTIIRAGNQLIIGSTGPENESGAVYIFGRENDGWVHQQTVAPAGLTYEHRFGTEAAVAGDFMFVAAPAGDESPGSVYVYKRSPDGTWSEHGTLEGSAATDGASFGRALAANEQHVFVGAPGQNEATGAVYQFDYDASSDSWTEARVLSGRIVEDGDRYGSALELAENALYVGVPRFGNRVGAAIVYEPNPETGEWNSSTLMLPFAASTPSSFGSAISASGDQVWVGAPYGNGMKGSVFTFARDNWSASSILPIEDVESRDMYGASVDVNGDVGAVGVRGDDYGAGSVVVFERDATGNWTNTARLRSEAEALEPITGGQVECEDGAASLFDCEQIDLLSFLPISSLGGDRGVKLNDIWGWTDPTTGKEYALVGRVDGTSFVDVTDPQNPVYLGNLPKTEGSRGSAWRDMKVYKNHAFIVSDNAGEHGMQVFDLTKLRGITGDPVTFEEETVYHGINSAHNIVVNTETGFAYAVGSSGGGKTCGGGLHMINIQDPTNPTFAGCYAAAGTGRAGTGYTHDAQCIVYHGPDSEYVGREICFGSNETALNVADVSDKENPESIATAAYPNVSYTHQGWISEDHTYFYVNDELDELSGNASETRTLIWDITDLDDPQLVKEYTWGTQSSDHNLYILGNLMYQSNYVSGLRIHDISDPENPVEVGYFDTMPVGDNEPGFAGTWSNYPFFESGTIAVSSIGEGLFLLKKREEQGL